MFKKFELEVINIVLLILTSLFWANYEHLFIVIGHYEYLAKTFYKILRSNVKIDKACLLKATLNLVSNNPYFKL